MMGRALWRSVPVTALYRLPDARLVLAAQAGSAQLFSLQDKKGPASLCIDVLGSTSIQGFASIYHAVDEHILLAWGANLVRVLRLIRGLSSQWSLATEGEAIDVTDWVFSLCARSEDVARDGQRHIFFLNAHNEVRAISCLVSEHGISLQCFPTNLIERRLVMLYNGHISIINDRLVVAAGTMFGQVLFEVYDFGSEPNLESLQAKVVTRDVFHDHEGSVFGVSVFEHQITVRGKAHYRLASCSDDRTVRVYQIPETVMTDLNAAEEDARTGFIDFLDLPTATPGANTGEAMGHESRIWSVLWLSAEEQASVIMTFGEDTTAQTWNIKHAQTLLVNGTGQQATLVVNADTYGFHTGKNIWAASVSPESNFRIHVCTGGADGRIVSYCLLSESIADQSKDPERSVLLQDDLAAFSAPEPTAHDAVDVRDAGRLFAALEGRWRLNRTITSKRPEYPSGQFVGEAKVVRRRPSSDEYNGEMAYEEEGQFTFASGPTMTARRKYIYRYQKSTSTITAWFVKPDEPDVVDYLFHKVDFKSASTTQQQQSETTRASGYHLCIADHYNAAYEFTPDERGLKSWKLSYNVQGPQKDYVASATYLPIDIASSMDTKGVRARKPDSFRSYTWLSHRECLITTDHGCILSALIDNDERTTLEKRAQISALKSYSLTSVLDSRTTLIAAANGELFQYQSATEEIDLLHAFGSKIVSLITIRSSSSESPSILVKCLRDSFFCLCHLEQGGSTEKSRGLKFISAETPKGHVATSAAFLGDCKFLVVGSRGHGISLWRVSEDTELAPMDKCQNQFLHGQNTVTSIVPLNSRGDADADGTVRFATTGRDGTFQVHQLSSTDSIETIHNLRWPFGPNLEGASLASKVVLWGFDGTDFVVFNQSRNQEVMRVTCGNAHRNWALKLDAELGEDFMASLVWTQANSCHFRSQKDNSHALLSEGGHGREIKALTATKDSFGEFVATGAEDTDIKLFTTKSTPNRNPDEAAKTIQPLHYQATLAKHQTGLTSLKFHKNHLFSAGGKEELFMWKLQRMPAPLNLAIAFQAACPKVEDGLLRVTDFCFIDCLSPAPTDDPDDITHLPHLAAIYSDSTLRIWRCTTTPPSFIEISGGRYTQHCLTCVAPLEHIDADKVHLITASTDGYLAIWEADIRYPPVNASPVTSPECTALERHSAHANAIKAMLVQPIDNDRFVVVTGGDDGAVVVTLLTLRRDASRSASASASASESGSRYIAHQTRIPRSHAAAVNAITLVSLEKGTERAELVVATSGSDQRVVTWELSVEGAWGDWGERGDGGLRVSRRVARTAVADVSGVVKLDGGLLVVGVGMEMLGLEE